MSAAFDLQRFLDAQAGGTIESALEQLRGGRKTGHWMWFVFPQLRGLGSSPTSQRYGIADLDEARAYAAHPVLGERLIECGEAPLGLAATVTAVDVFGPVDALKLRSCATLFDRAAPEHDVFRRLLDRFYGGAGDGVTAQLLASGG